MDRARRLFVAGSTGAVGRQVVGVASARGVAVVPHLRPRAERAAPADERAAVFELADADALTGALRACTTVVQLIGTTRSRFATGDTYETSDIGTTKQLVHAAVTAGVDHFVLLSSVGAGRPLGAYLKAKARAEALVVACGIPYTIVRPSTFMGEGHSAPPGMQTLTRWFGMKTYQPIAVSQLAALLVHVAARRTKLGEVLEGASLWQGVGEALAGE